MGGFVILDVDGKEMVRARRYYGAGLPNNDVESFTILDAFDFLTKLVYHKSSLEHPVRVFGDSQLMIRFMTRLFKYFSRYFRCWALK